MKFFLLGLILTGCGLVNEQAVEDFIEGEAQVAEKVVEDISGHPHPTNPPK